VADVSTGWPVVPEGWEYAGTTERVDFYLEPSARRSVPGCDVNWGSHGCHRRHLHRGHHHCDPCHHHPWWLHAVLYWSAHLFRRSRLIDEWWGGCVERWPYYGGCTRFYGNDAP
jgi:hypothetical protein